MQENCIQTVQVIPGNVCLDDADPTAPSRQYKLEHADSLLEYLDRQVGIDRLSARDVWTRV